MKNWRSPAIVFLTAIFMTGTAGAQILRFRALGSESLTASLSGAQEVPAVDAPGRGTALFSVSDDRSEVSFKVTVANVREMTQSHIHCAAAGVNGPIVVFLFGLLPEGESLNGILAQGSFKEDKLIVRPDSAACPGGVASLEELLAKMETGQAYVNVHTIPHPSGEIRGQIRPALS